MKQNEWARKRFVGYEEVFWEQNLETNSRPPVADMIYAPHKQIWHPEETEKKKKKLEASKFNLKKPPWNRVALSDNKSLKNN